VVQVCGWVGGGREGEAGVAFSGIWHVCRREECLRGIHWFSWLVVLSIWSKEDVRSRHALLLACLQPPNT
jgi:hypothetical protein